LIASINFNDYRVFYLPSQKVVSACSASSQTTFPYTLCAIEAALTLRKNDVMDYVNTYGGSIVALEESVDPCGGGVDPGCPGAFGWLPLPLTSMVREIAHLLPTTQLSSAIPSIISGNQISHDSYHVGTKDVVAVFIVHMHSLLA
jgi:hypothetical protein